MTLPLSTELQCKIRELALSDMRTTHIATHLGINRNSVMRYRKAMGLPSKPSFPGKEVLSLLKSGTERRRIARTLKVPYRQVYAFARSHGFGRPRKELSPEQRLRLVEDVLSRSASAAALAKKHNASYRMVLALAHDLLKCERFLPSWRTPLSSYFPSRPPRPMHVYHDEEESLMLQLVDKVCRRFLDGALPVPAKEKDFIEALSVIVIPKDGSPDLQQCPREMVRADFEAQLHEAITTLRQSQSGLVN